MNTPDMPDQSAITPPDPSAIAASQPTPIPALDTPAPAAPTEAKPPVLALRALPAP